MIVVPDYATFRDVSQPLFEELWPQSLYQVRIEQGGPKIYCQTGEGVSEILIRSAMNRQVVQRIDGPTVAWAWIDEPSRMQQGETAFNKVMGRIRQPAEYNGVFVTGSPRGTNWIARAFDQMDRLPASAWEHGVETKPGYYIRAARTKDNSANAEGYYERLVEAYGEQYALQELEGDIVSQEGRIYPNFYEHMHVIPHALAMRLYDRTVFRAGGADWGWTNPAATIYAGRTGDYQHVVIGEFYERGERSRLQPYEAWRYTQAPHYVRRYYCDPSDPKEIDRWNQGAYVAGKKYVAPAVPADNEWMAGTRAVRAALELRGVGELDHPAKAEGNRAGSPRLLISDRCVNLIAEIRDYREEEKSETKTPSEKAVGEDHLLDALRYYVMGAEAGWSGSPARMIEGLTG
jgi:hypothetical protein